MSHFEVIIIGGSYAGLSAALQLARARRRVLVVDGGARRNRFSPVSHGFLGHDGRAAEAIIADGRADVLAYPTVTWLDATIAAAQKTEDGFVVALENGERHEARRLVLATGVADQLPALDGLEERWGKSVFKCPYCHGYELNEGRIGVLTTVPSGKRVFDLARILSDWGQVTLFANDRFVPDEKQAAELDALGVAVQTGTIRRISERATVELEGGRRFPMDGLFLVSRIRMASPLAEQLGCAFDEFPPVIRTDARKLTSVPGVFACGDAAGAGNVALAVADGAIAGKSAHQSLCPAEVAM